MKKIVLFLAAAATLAACTKWENKSTEFKVTGVWTGVNQQLNFSVPPFFDTTYTQSTTSMEANFMENGGLTIDSAGTRLDSMGWAIKNDTVLVLKGIDMGIGNPLGGGGSAPSNMSFVIRTLEQESFIFRYDTTFSMQVDPSLPNMNVNMTQIQRWGK
jgi:hypothetical protein